MPRDVDVFDSHRNAHRVFLERKGAHRFNPFRHIPWDVRRTSDDVEGQPTHHQGLALHTINGESIETFAVNIVAEIPLWFMCDYALEEIEKYLGPTLSDLIDIFTTNTVQIISSILLLVKSKQVNLSFNRLGAQGASTLLSIAATSLLIPTSVKLLGQTTQENLLKQSRGVAVVLLFVYIAYTFCQMVTHRKDYYDATLEGGHQPRDTELSSLGSPPSNKSLPSIAPPIPRRASTLPNPTDLDRCHPPLWSERAARQLPPESNEICGPQLHFAVALFVFAASIVLLYFCIDATVDSVKALTEQTSLTPMFVGLVLLPIPNCDFAPISLAVDNYLEQTMRYTVGRSVQTALLVEPMVVLLGWWTGLGEVTLAFDGFEVVSLFTTILLLGFLMVDAKVHWVHGLLLLADWVLIGIAAYFVSSDSLK
ncbi:uncharacterized protein E0L32_011868 [Thyridium curvatum]|uniref:Sodium/calcium exchanger membrane region domain-containing protein n=1 Tax=Thyridium curvatum TaxID=1093900 RepID=A0A507BKP7_9PEZI|nr:uncharacterized protein E0L32_011868 [Thyridium curvatum]TPX18049.1 hypothetical protein E0L32_011868 [Thyridium curvatum]